jgi:alpha-glucosidase
MSEWWRSAVIYQVYPRSFADSNGDGIGDLAGIVAHLDHIARLGVDGIWLSPFFTSPMADYGYDVADYCNVDPMFGTLADFQALLAAAHAHGLKVVIDQVYSHTSKEHPWFLESRRDRTNPRADWYVWADAKPDGTAPNNWMAAFGGVAWTWDTGRNQYYFHNFLPEQPDLDVRNPAVQEALLEVARFWLELGVDGFRLDVANYFMQDPLLRDNPPRAVHDGTKPLNFQQHVHNKSQPDNLAFIERLRGVMDEYPERMTVAEIKCDRNLERMAEYTAHGRRLSCAYSFHLLGGEFSARFVRETVEAFFAQPGSPWPAWAFSNHDVPRAPSRWGRDSAAAAIQLNALMLSLPGTLFLYQGEELGLPVATLPLAALRDPEAINNWPNHRNRDGARTPMPWRADAPHAGFSTGEPWLPVAVPHVPLAVDRQEVDAGSVLAATRALLAWRRSNAALRERGWAFIDLPEPLLGIIRGDAIACLFNFGEGEARVDMAGALAPVSRAVRQGEAVVLPGRGFAWVAI